MAARRNAMFEQAGLPHAPQIDRLSRTRKALMLSELARERGRLETLHPRLFDAFWARGLDLGDEAVLLAEAAAVGLDPGESAAALHDARYGAEVDAATRRATEIGADGVPAWVIDRRVLIPGAQPHEVFERVLERLGHRPSEQA